MRSYTHYWRNQTGDEQAVEPLRQVVGGDLRQRGLAPGDLVYPVTVREGKLYVAGRLTIDRVVDLRRTRYIGLAKTHLQHVVTAAATNVLRLVAWFEEVPRGFTRRSALARLALTRV